MSCIHFKVHNLKKKMLYIMHIPFSNSNVNQYRKSSRPKNTQSTKACFSFFFYTLEFQQKVKFQLLMTHQYVSKLH